MPPPKRDSSSPTPKVSIGDIGESRLLAAADKLGIEVAARLDVTDPVSFRAFYATVTDRLGNRIRW